MPSQPPSASPLQPTYLLLGEILRPHGVAGEVRMRVLTSYPEHIRDHETLFLADEPDATEATAHKLQSVRMHQGYALLKFEGINDRDQAEFLRQLYVMVERGDAVPLEEGEFYLYQLIGLNIETDDGKHLGTLREVLETGANDVYIVDSPEYGEILIPVTPDTIIKTDVEGGVVVVKLIDGLLPG